MKEKETFYRKKFLKNFKHDLLCFEHSSEINYPGIEKFELIIKNKNAVEIHDMNINLYLSALEIEFINFKNQNPLLLSETELKSSLEIAEFMIINHETENPTKLESLSKQKFIDGEHIISIFKSAIKLLKKQKPN